MPTDLRREDRLQDARPDQRTPFQRDRDRILYSSASRRLGGVTQVVGPGEGRIFHNRLTHSLKVAQLGRRLAEKVRMDVDPDLREVHEPLDPEVVEAAALAHDLGHPPFGHVAESKLSEMVRARTGAPDATGSEMREGFEGNAQSFRIVTRLSAHRVGYRGLNLTRAALAATLKYPWMSEPAGHKKYGAYLEDEEAFHFARAQHRDAHPSLEAQLMDHADNLAYSVHDLEDFVRAGLIPSNLGVLQEKVEDLVEDWKVVLKEDGQNELLEAVEGYEIEGFSDLLYNLLGEEPYLGTFEQRANLREGTSVLLGRFLKAISVEESSGGLQARMTGPERVEMKFLQRLVWIYVIENPRLSTQQEGQRRIIAALFDAYAEAIARGKQHFLPEAFSLHLEYLPDVGSTERARSEARLAADIVSSFSDHEALTMFHRISGVSPGSVLDLLHA